MFVELDQFIRIVIPIVSLLVLGLNLIFSLPDKIESIKEFYLRLKKIWESRIKKRGPQIVSIALVIWMLFSYIPPRINVTVTNTRDMFDNNLVGGRLNKYRMVKENSVLVQKNDISRKVTKEDFAYWQFSVGSSGLYDIKDFSINMSYENTDDVPINIVLNRKEEKKAYPLEPVHFNPENVISADAAQNVISIFPLSDIYLKEMTWTLEKELAYRGYITLFISIFVILYFGGYYHAESQDEDEQIKLTFSKAESYDKLSEILILIESTEKSLVLLKSSYSKGEISKKTYDKLVNEAEEHLELLNEEKESHEEELSEIINSLDE